MDFKWVWGEIITNMCAGVFYYVFISDYMHDWILNSKILKINDIEIKEKEQNFTDYFNNEKNFKNIMEEKITIGGETQKMILSVNLVNKEIQ